MTIPAFPDTLPCVSRIDNYGFNALAALIRTPFEAGNARQRRVHARMPHEIALAWRVSNADLWPLFAWLNTYGYDWFTLNLAGVQASMDGVQSEAIEVRLMSDLQVSLFQFHRANWWTVRASAEYQPPVDVLVSPITSGAGAMMFVQLTRVSPDPEYGSAVYVNMDQALSMSRNVGNTGTRIRGVLVDPTTTQQPVLAETLPRAAPLAVAPVVNQEWQMDSQITAGPGTGRMRLNNAAQAQASVMWINYTTIDSIDAKTALATVANGAQIDVANKSDSTKSARYTVRAAPIDHGTYIEFPVTFVTGGGQLMAQRASVVIVQEAPAPSPSPKPNLIEVIVKETPEQIAALVAGAQRSGTRIIGAPHLSESPAARAVDRSHNA